MADFLQSAGAFVVLMVALGLVRVARGPGRAERMMAAQLLGTGAIGALLLLLPRFLWQSLVAGTDVARRAFAPRLDLQPGFVDYRTQLPPGSARNAFELIASLMPGSVPSDDTQGTIEFHCLDTRQPVAEQLAAEERVYARALLPGTRDG
jgi:multicomponent Na+:H+ antiporter subunit E